MRRLAPYIGFGLLTGLFIGATVVSLVRTSAPAAADSRQAEMESSEFDPLAALSEYHQDLIDQGGLIVRGTVDDHSALLSGSDLLIDHIRVIWPDPSQRPPGRIVVQDGFLPSGHNQELPPPWEVIAAISRDGDLLSVAATAQGEVVPLELHYPRTILAHGAVALQDGYAPLQPVAACTEPVRLTSANPLDALESYFQLLGETSEVEAARRLQNRQDTVRELEAEGMELRDPVTGRFAPPNLNDIEYQLDTKESADAVVLRPAIPVRIVVPEIKSDGSQVALFTGEESGRVLGWLPIEPTFDVNDDGTLTPVFSFVLDIAPPEPGESVAIYIQQESAPDECVDDDQPQLVIPHDEIAGSRRATLDLARLAVSPFDE